MAEWYFGENGQQIGPLDEIGIRQAILHGRVMRQTLVWREGMAEWVPFAAVPELSAAAPMLSPMAPGMMVPPTSGLAVASMVCGIVSLVLCQGIGAIPAVVCGHMALSQINSSPLPMSGRGMAIAGLVMGYVQFLLVIIAAVVLVMLVASR